MTKRILLLEDEKNLGATLQDWLGREGFEVSWAQDIGAARECLSQFSYDLALLDVNLPQGSGLDFAAECQKVRPQTVIIFLTARGLPAERVRGLELGASDYIVKPFHLRELKIRIERALQSAPLNARLQIGQAQVDFACHQAEVGGQTYPLSQKEVAILQLLLARRGQVVSRDEILDKAWSVDEYPTPRTVDNFILRLRRLIEVSPENPVFIRSVRKMGYQLLGVEAHL